MSFLQNASEVVADWRSPLHHEVGREEMSVALEKVNEIRDRCGRERAVRAFEWGLVPPHFLKRGCL